MRKFVGAKLDQGKASFTVWAPLVSKVELELTGDNDKQIISMHSEEYGYWHAQVDNMQAGQRYGFKLDDSQAYPDPASRSQPDGVFGLSALTALDAYQWQDAQWTGKPLSEMIIYELHVGTFTPEGTFEAVIDKLDYLLELGVNTIELMPVAQFSGNRNWGYDGVFPYAVQHSYGGPDGLKKLVDACHQKGIAVFLDVIYNHIGPEGSCMHHYGPYFSSKYMPVWGHPFNFDEPHSDQVRNYFIGNALMWFEEYHIDALRLDATDHILDFSAKHFLAELSEHVQQLRAQSGKSYLLVAERDLNDTTVFRPLEQGGYGFDGQWLDNFHHALRTLATQDRSHYYADYGSIKQLQKAFVNSYVYNGTYSHYRKRTHGVSVDAFSYDRFVAFSQNHDQVGNRLLSDRLSTQVSPAMLRVVAGTYLLSPYVPLLFMGEEYGETNPFYFFIHHSDLELIQAVREGRKREFMGFQREGLEYQDPQSEETFLQSKLSWDLQAEGRQSLFHYYQQLIQIRKTKEAFANFSRQSLNCWIEKDAVLLWTRQPMQADNPVILCVANFGKSSNAVQLPAGNWQQIAGSQEHEFALEDLPILNLPAESFWVFEGTFTPALLTS